jgi:DNA-binding transcriptional LysR family regulator
MAEHPRIDVRIDASYERRALAGEGFDVAVRYGPIDRLGREGGEPLFAESVQPLCAPALQRGRRALRLPADLRHHTLLHVITESSDASVVPLEWQAWLQAVGESTFEAEATLTFSTYDTAVAAALEGQGVLLGRRPLTDGLLEQGRLVAPFKGQMASARGYFVVLDAVAARRPAVAALVTWLHAMARGLEAPVQAGRPAPARAAAVAKRPGGRAKVLAGQ